MKSFVVLVLLGFVYKSHSYPTTFNRTYEVNVIQVISGDQVMVKKVNSSEQPMKLRLALIDAPKINQSYGVAAKNHLEKLLGSGKGKKIRIIVNERPDKSGRFHAVIFAGNRDLNRKMIFDGFAWCYRKIRCPYIYQYSMSLAKIRKVGLWKKKKPVPPWEWKQPKSNTRATEISSKKKRISVTLDRVVDGDTVYVIRYNSKDKSVIKVRMVGIDTPEMKQSYGPEAKNHLQTIFDNLSTSSPLTLVVEGTDKYKRTLGVIFSGSIDINKKMVQDGYAWCYRHTECPKSYETAMKKAQKNRKGLFIQEKITTPWDWRKEQKN